jgi:hypothetical protein
MYGRPGLMRRRPLLRAAAVGGAFAAGRAMGRQAAGQASAETSQEQRIAGQSRPLLRAEEQQDRPLLRAEDQQDRPLLRAEDQQDRPLLRAEDQPSRPLLRADDQQHPPLLRAAPPRQDTGGASAADQLSRLAQLHQQGELTDEEFAAAKAKTLRS